jgi:hypothetical protein
MFTSNITSMTEPETYIELTIYQLFLPGEAEIATL